MDSSGEVVLLREIGSWSCPAMIRVCGLVTFIDLHSRTCELSNPQHTSLNSDDSDGSNAIGNPLNQTSLSQSLLVKCDRVDLTGADLYRLRTFIGLLQEMPSYAASEELMVDETGVTNSTQIPSSVPFLSPSSNTRAPTRMLIAYAAVSSDGLDMNLYERVVVRRRQYLQQDSQR